MSNLKFVHEGVEVNDSPIEEGISNSKAKKDIDSLDADTRLREGVENRKILLEFSQRQLQLINHASQHIDTKLGVVIGFALIALAQILSGAMNMSEYELSLMKSHGPLSVLLVISLVGAFSSTAIAAVFGFLALTPRPSGNVNVQPGLRERDKREKDLLDGCLEGIDAVIDRARQSNQDRIRHATTAAGAVGVAVGFYVVFAFTILMILA